MNKLFKSMELFIRPVICSTRCLPMLEKVSKGLSALTSIFEKETFISKIILLIGLPFI